MKKIFLAMIILLSAAKAGACDICGCGAGSNYIGILPEFRKHIFGIRYRYNFMQTHLGVGGATTYLTSKESYRTVEAWGGWNFGKNFRVMASIPYSYDERTNQGVTNSKNGLADITINGYYQLINKRSALKKNKLLVQSLWLGGGIKLPTGKYDPADKTSGSENTNLFQLGTGSTDFSLNAMYDLRVQDAGINMAVNYKMNTANKYDYRYGNKWNSTAQFYYKFRIKNKVLLAPNAGVQYEYSDKDMDRKLSVDISGGYVFSGTAGLELGYRKIALGANFQSPFSQKLANDIVRAHNRAMLHIAFIF
jgi:hypothetical protein